ncbi:FHA domain-containing protein [Nonomuraea sp. NPDC049725]|uniref:FHA domain-containing protein n=1 Tax=Nonomuraea sp. NPDC049725 TaxID=3154508 RepID=UPI0034489763
MSYNDAVQPCLVVTSRPMAGASFEIFTGHTEIGSAHGAGIQLDCDGVSRRHASIDNDGRRTVISDLGSLNGTWVNGRKLTSGHVLRDGDQVRIGFATLRFMQAEEPEPEYGYRFGDVAGPVNAGSGHLNVGGRQQIAGGDIYGDAVHVTDDYDPWDEVFQGRGPGRGIAVLGACVSLLGFALFAGVIFSGFSGKLLDDPFAQELVDGIPSAPAGFALFLGGGLLAALGLSMAKAARKRTEPRKGRRRQRGGAR